MSGPSGARRRSRLRRAGVVASFEVVATAIVVASVMPSATGQTAAGQTAAGAVQAAAPAAAFTTSKTIDRTNLVNGVEQVVDGPRDFTVSVSETAGLRNRQVITVKWSGGHPTGGLIANQQGAQANEQEYPVVLMECHGIDSSSAPLAAQLSPSTCWTATPQERVFASPSGTPLWYLDRYVPASERVPLVGAPPNYGELCPFGGGTEWMVPFTGADGTNYPIGPGGCAGEPPDMVATQSAGVLPSDTTYAVTGGDGTGQAKFSIETADANQELGCSQAVPCSLVVIPIEGLSCDPSAALNQKKPDTTAVAECETDGVYSPGEPNLTGQTQNDLAVTGGLWYMPSNWRNRISVPLGFAPSADICSQANKSAPVAIYGSEALAEATTQWNPHFCLSATGFNVNHVQTSEPEAKNLLANRSIDAALQTAAPPNGGTGFFPTPTVQAPVAVTGFAISYVIDNADGQPYQSLKLDARLLAKLMTESYPGLGSIAVGDTAIAKNPLTIWDDPEFQALNPTLLVRDHAPLQGQPAGAASLFSVLGRSDVIYALTSYINADPDARAWLNGVSDPWGMTVNPAYKGITLPVDNWQLLDTNEKGPLYDGGEGIQNDCLNQSPIPARPLLDAPSSSLALVGLNLQFGIAPSVVWCTLGNAKGVFNFQSIGAEPVGARFIIGVVPLALAQEYELDNAALQTYVSPSAPAKFTDGADRLFVAPSDSSLKAAAALLKPDDAVGSWVLPYSSFATDSSTAAAYPGTLLVSMDVPTSGLDKTSATDLSQYMAFAAGAGQTPGQDTGQLPDGYLPLTSANGLGNQLAYTQAAIADVAAQNGQVPPLVPVSPSGSKKPSSSGQSPPPSSGQSNSAVVPTATQLTSGATGGIAGGGRTPSLATNSRTTAQPTGSSSGPSAPSRPAAAVGTTAALGAGIGALALPIALLVALLGGLVAASDRLAATGRLASSLRSALGPLNRLTRGRQP